jgi:hypothetical protein
MIRSARALTLAVGVAVLSATMLAGCAPAAFPTAGQTNISTTPGGSAEKSSPTPNAIPSGSTLPSGNSTTADGPPPPPPPPSVDACYSALFTVTYIAGDNTAGQAHGTLKFLNKSTKACYTYGFPLAKFIYNFNPIGKDAATAGADSGAAITVQPGQWLLAPITFTDADFIDGCTVVQSTQLNVMSPGADDNAAVLIPSTDACNNPGIGTITVGAVVFE